MTRLRAVVGALAGAAAAAAGLVDAPTDALGLLQRGGQSPSVDDEEHLAVAYTTTLPEEAYERNRDEMRELDKNSPEVGQYSHITGMNRYPRIFDSLQALLKGAAEPRVLSYGCSSGAEVRTVREHLPRARVHGYDVLTRIIEENSAKNDDAMVEYIRSPFDLQAASYDAVLVLGVLSSWPNSVMAFRDVEKTLRNAHLLLRPGGYLAVYNPSYPFSEFSIYDSYVDLAKQAGCSRINGTTPEDGLHSRKPSDLCVAGGEPTEQQALFCIESGWSPKFSRDGTRIQGEPQYEEEKVDGCQFPGVLFQKK